MAVALLVLTCLFRFPFARPPFVAMGLIVGVAFLATLDGPRLDDPDPYRTQQTIVVILLVVAYVRRRAVTHPVLRRLIFTSATVVSISTLFMLVVIPTAQPTLCAMAYGASAVLALGVLVSRHLAIAPLPDAVVRQRGTGLVAPLRWFAQFRWARPLQSRFACAPTGCRSTQPIRTTPSRRSSPGA